MYAVHATSCNGRVSRCCHIESSFTGPPDLPFIWMWRNYRARRINWRMQNVLQCRTNFHFVDVSLMALWRFISSLYLNVETYRARRINWRMQNVLQCRANFHFANVSLLVGGGDKLKIPTSYILLHLKIWRRSILCQVRWGKMKSISGDPCRPKWGLINFIDLPIGPMENAKNPKFEFYFDCSKNVF